MLIIFVPFVGPRVLANWASSFIFSGMQFIIAMNSIFYFTSGGSYCFESFIILMCNEKDLFLAEFVRECLAGLNLAFEFLKLLILLEITL